MKTKKQFTIAILILALVLGMIPVKDVLAKKSLYSVEDSSSDNEEKQVTLSKGDTYRVSRILGVNMTRLAPSLRDSHIFLPAY